MDLKCCDGKLFWTEGRPTEGGRYVTVRWDNGVGDITGGQDLTPEGYNARTRVHEYGGGAFVPNGKGGVCFTNFADQSLVRLLASPMTQLVENIRFGGTADFRGRPIPEDMQPLSRIWYLQID